MFPPPLQLAKTNGHLTLVAFFSLDDGPTPTRTTDDFLPTSNEVMDNVSAIYRPDPSNIPQEKVR